MQSKSAILVLGYNNTRINDVKKIRETAVKYLNAVTVLCKKSPNTEDFDAADYVIDVGLEGNSENAAITLDYCNKFNIKIIGLLPFSDAGTQLGAYLAKQLNLRGPNPAKIKAALDKFSFREAEKTAVNIPRGYKKISATKINTLEELTALYHKFNGKIFIKPTQEGNSRGCLRPLSEQDCETAWQELDKYKNIGIIVEELIESSSEYSFDHVAGYSWVTEKKTTQTNYRAEYQQLVPAPISKELYETIIRAGYFMADISGANDGACHNEIFYLEDYENVAAVEPNLRPAGMRIWDLAAIAFEKFDPWKEWLLWATNNEDESQHGSPQDYYAAIRMIAAPYDGTLEEIKPYTASDFQNDTAELLELTWTKNIGDTVTTNIKDNADFLGYFIARSKSYHDLIDFLETTALKVKELIKTCR